MKTCRRQLGHVCMQLCCHPGILSLRQCGIVGGVRIRRFCMIGGRHRKFDSLVKPKIAHTTSGVFHRGGVSQFVHDLVQMLFEGIVFSHLAHTY